MDINTTKTDSYEFHKSGLAEKTDESFDSEQIVFKSFSIKLQVEDTSSAPVEKVRGLGTIAPGFGHQIANQTIPERKVSHWVASDDCEAINAAEVSETFTPEEVAGHFRATIENLRHSPINEKITRESYEYNQTNELTEIFIDFILCREGLVHDRCFTVECSPDKYVAGKTMSQGRVEEIKSFLNAIFSEWEAEGSKTYWPRVHYGLEDMLVDYLKKKENVQDDVAPKIVSSGNFWHKIRFEKLLKEIYPFFQILLDGRGFFSEFGVVFNFFVKFKQELVDSAREPCRTNKLIIALRENRSHMREYFNRHVLDVIFSGHCDGIVNAMFSDSSFGTDNEAKPSNRSKLKLGEELEYDIKNDLSRTRGRLCNIFSSLLKEKGMSDQAIADQRGVHYGFDDRFTVVSFYDSSAWFEINCTPYHPDDERAKLSFEKVIEVIDSMRNKGLIDYSSGHKHVDALSATQGDAGVLLAMESEIQRNPFLLRAFGNNDRILQKNEARWYKTFADYNPDTKPFAVKRLNRIIDLYNKKIEENHTGKPGHKGSTDWEKKERLEQFAHFYSQLVHMTTIQKGLGYIDVDIMEKYMAMSLLHITGANRVNKLSTLEFRFFRCPKTVQEIDLINQFLQAWFGYIHQCRKDKIPLQPVPEDIKSCKDYTAAEVQLKTIEYLSKLGLNPEEYRCFWGEVRDNPSAPD
ncbi:hypothetical protein [Endozoicomonas sp. 8E]|uniref:hypothetical protein n=1 Tax=Endozoicomonas sp. 8E TaxID=3035692 RepID=UPI002938F509|nr:hypothetical protein [Endozoicomonas sp. 8E]WOG28129.1 hypothetical protein P6910_00315 [Endozoicomonas sp. 8E]